MYINIDVKNLFNLPLNDFFCGFLHQVFELGMSLLNVQNLLIMNHCHGAPVAQLVEYRAVTQEVVSSTPAGPSLRVLK